MCTAKNNIITPFIYFEKDVISGAGYLSQCIFGCTFLHASSHNPDPFNSSALLFDFHIPALWLAEIEELGGGGAAVVA